MDNAELHGNADERWYVIGYFNRDALNAIDSSCHIVLFNFGDSLHQSLRRSASIEMRRDLSDLAQKHQKSFLSTGEKFDEATLWTLYALQEGVSRFSHQSDQVGRGGGTVDLIRFFSELSGGAQKMSIVSGSAYILNDGSFKPGKDERNNTVLAFNADNDLRKAPDARFVRALGAPFPGTLISLRFPFEKGHLERLSLEAVNASESSGEVFRPLVVHYDESQKVGPR